MTATTPLTPGPQPVAGAYDPGRGHEIQAFIPRAGEVFSLPSDVPKYAAVELLAEALRTRGATETEIAVFRHIAAPTAAHAWHDGDVPAVNFRRQADMAREMGLGERHFRRIEGRLEGFGVLGRATADNGYRGRRSGQGNRPVDCGLSLEPALANYMASSALLAHRDHLEEERQRMVFDARSTRRRVVRLAGTLVEPGARARAAAGLEELDRARPVPLRGADIEDLRGWMAAALALERAILGDMDPDRAAGALEAERLPDLAAMADGAPDPDGVPDAAPAPAGDIAGDTAGPPRGSGRSGGSGRAQEAEPPAPEAPVPETDGPERAPRGGTPGIIRPDVLRLLDGPGLMELASADAALYLGAMDWRKAATYICRDLGIHPSAWEEAVGVMTEGIAFIALLVLDRNRFHPERPTVSPGGVLRAMTDLARRGGLDLSRSVLGILARSRRGAQPRDRAAGPRPDA